MSGIDGPEIMVIGGAEIFSLMMPAMSRMWVSKVKGNIRRILFFLHLRTGWSVPS